MTTQSIKFTPDQVAKFFGVSLENVKKQYSHNASDLSVLAKKAKSKKINGYTGQQLEQMSQAAFLKSV